MDRPRVPLREWWFLHLVVGSTLALGYMASPGGGAWELLFTAVGAWSALGVGIVARRQTGPTARGLALASAGLAAATFGDLVLTSYELRGVETPFPSLGDAGYAAGYVLLSAGLVVLAKRRTARESIIDACIVTAGVSGVVWLSVVVPLLEPGWSLSTVVALSYPVGSILLLISSALLWLGWGLRATGIRLLAFGLFAWLVADAVYAHQALDGTYQNGTILDAGWLLAYVLVAAGAMHPTISDLRGSQHEAAMLTPHRFLLLSVAAAATPAATAVFDLQPVAPLMVLTVVGIALSAVRLARPVRALRQHALRDALTGLPNRRLLMERLTDEIDHLEDGCQVALLFLDLDHFKVINDSLGHAAGDELLCTIAERLVGCVREGSTVARLGGDEFVVCFTTAGDATVVAEQVAERVLSEVGAPVTLSCGQTVRPSVSIGVRVATDRSTHPDLLLGDADAAMYTAKARGRGAAARFDDSMRAAAVDRLVADSELRRAIDEHEIHCVYQPEIDLQTGALFGLECLVRWDHPRLGLLGPDRFVPHAEANGAISDLFALVLDEALAAQRLWAEALGAHPAIAVNVSAAQRTDGDFVTSVLAALARHGAPPESLWLEVTESGFGDDDLADALSRLRQHGVRVAVDDFGTGWSSLARLAMSQWDALKIDRSFTSRITDEAPEVTQVVTATVAMAHALGMLTVAEGVETADELAAMRTLGCDVAQGHALASPAAASDVVALIESLVPGAATSAVLGQDD